MSIEVAFIMLLVIAAALMIVVVGGYNKLVRARNTVDNAWAQIEVQLNRRHDLIPNLVETVKGYAGHERRVFEAVTAARASAISAQGPAQLARAENQLTEALRSVFAVAEAYPQLQASGNFAELQAELSDTENRVAYSRQYYNDAVLAYHNAIHTVPTNIVAGMTGFGEREFFTAPEPERGPAQVRF